MQKVVWWVMVLIGIYLVATNSFGVNSILQTLSRASTEGIATLQGRNVKGVTS